MDYVPLPLLSTHDSNVHLHDEVSMDIVFICLKNAGGDYEYMMLSKRGSVCPSIKG